MNMQPGKTKKPGRRRRWRSLGFALIVVVGLGAVGIVSARVVIDDIAASLPPVPEISTLAVSTEVVDRSGQLLRPFTTKNGLWRLPVSLEDVDRDFIEMLIAYEDQNFEQHNGIDWGAMVRAARQFIGAGGHIVSGGSTLSMQVARLLEQGTTRSFSTKIRQMVHASVLEQNLSKQQILTLYLTLAPYGGNIEGIRAASLAYFGKEPKRLTTAEAALLVALPQSPEARRPDRNPENALSSRNGVLKRMVGAGVLSEEEAEAASGEPTPTARRAFPLLAPHLTREAVVAQPDVSRIELNVDGRIQGALEALGAWRAEQLGPAVSVAIIVADQRDGNILASVGSAGLFTEESDGFVNMTRAVRSPGSTLKPLIYGLAFELGLAHPESLIEDRPTAFSGYAPVNFDGDNRGTVSIRQALTESINVPAVIVLDAVGTPRLVSRLRRGGAEVILPGDTAPGLAIGLGGVGVTLRGLVSLYTAIARGGTPVALSDGVEPLTTSPGPRAPVLDPVAAWYVSDILADAPPPLNGSPGRIAYKTGTSYGYRDAWAIGYDGRYVIGVWVGRPDGRPVPGLSGIVTAAPVLFESFDRLGVATTPLRDAPSGVLFASNPELPEPLRRFRHPNDDVAAREPAPEISFPRDGVEVDLGLAAGSEAPLFIKIRNGVPPFTFLANGAPFGRTAFARQNAWQPDGPGYVTLSVIDAEGRSDYVTVFLQ